MHGPSSRGILWGLAAAAVLLSGCRHPAPSATSRAEPLPFTRTTGESLGREEQSRARAHAHFSAGVVHEMSGESDAAAEQYSLAAREDLDNEELVLDLSRRLLALRKTDSALQLLELAARRPNMSEQVFVRLGVAYAQMGREAEAVAACEKAISKAPHSIAGYQALFVTRIQAGKEADALKVLERAGRQQGAPPEYYVALGDLYAKYSVQVPSSRELARTAGLEALRRAESGITNAPVPAGLNLALADGYSALGDQERAAEMYQRVLRAVRDLPALRERIHARLTDIYLRKDDRKRAVEQLQEIVKQDPTNPQAYYFLGSIAFEEKRYKEAEEYYRKTLLLNPEAEQAHYDLASTLINLGRSSEALRVLEEARAKFPASFVLEFLTGMAFSRQQGYAEALRYFVAAEVIARATDPGRLNEFFFFQLGATCERKGDFAEAERYLKLALEKAPDFSEAQNYLGYMWADRGEKLEEALALIEKAVAAEPENAAYIDSLGWVLFKMGKPQQALEHIQRAIRLVEEDDATLYDHLGDIQAALGNKSEAIQAWEKSLAIQPDEKVRAKLEAATR